MTRAARPKALRYRTKKRQAVACRLGTAAEVIGPLAEGVSITGATAGQFSAIDALEHMANEVGPADCMISTWTTGIYDVERSAALKKCGSLLSVRMLLDRAMFQKSPQYAGPLIDALGVDSFRCLSVHAKVVIARGPALGAVFRSSMNLNKNLRTENFDLDTCPDVVGFWSEWFDDLWQESGRSQDNAAIISAVFDRWKVEDKRAPRGAAKSGLLRPNPWKDAAG